MRLFTIVSMFSIFTIGGCNAILGIDQHSLSTDGGEQDRADASSTTGAPADAAPSDSAIPGTDTSPLEDAAFDAGREDVSTDAESPDSTLNADYHSCATLHKTVPNTPTGVYPILWDGSPKQTMCDMTTDGGGWTSFFVGTVGNSQVFAHFELTAESCVNPAATCLRRLPATTPATVQFMARCGAAAVRFTLPDAGVAYFASGATAGWQGTTNLAGVDGTPDLLSAAQVFTGGPGNYGWIISAGETAPTKTFASSYNSLPGTKWDLCDDVAANGASTALYFR